MRIAFFIKGLNGGGAERVAALLTCVWSRLGHEIVLFADQVENEREYNHIAIARELVDYSKLDEHWLKKSKGKYAFSIVVVNDAFNDGWLPRLMPSMKRIGVKTVVVNHHCPNSWLYSTINSDEVLLDATFALFDAMVFVDPIWTLWWHFRGFNSFYIPNPVSVGTSMCDFAHHKSHLLVWVGRLTDWAKQPEIAIDVFAEILKSVPDAQLVMLGAKDGKTEKHLRKRLEQKIKTSSSDCLTFAGFIPDTTEYLHKASINLFTSLTEVTVPQVVMEAQAVGVPTVAVEQPILEGATGVVMGNTVKELADSSVRILKGDGISNRLRTALTEYSAQAENRDSLIGRSWDELISCILDERLFACFRQQHIQGLKTEENYGRLIRELHRSEQYFVKRYLPQVHLYQKWRKRMNVQYLISRVMARLKSLGVDTCIK